ncbi:unnamed protein product [Caenorhabditis auriculariae]|uniref:Centrosomal protein CEP104 Zn finger domain-containing protein n=1 Tax=Caenorhabditis auriculariae TaxID=2777116 RepID=A0A8S1HIY8_9PELO|nr:unnamed protein product [Caenorhabditis auriculariae]
MEEADLRYEDYVRRRDAEMAKNGRFAPVEELPEEKEKDKLKGDGRFELPNSEYRSAGYKEKALELGEDPIIAVRTLRNNLRVMSLTHKDKDRPVKAHLCQSACEELSKTEEKLVGLSHDRSDAITRGDVQKAHKIRSEMEKVKSDAIRNTYSDLMIEDSQMKAFGVNSRWTPDKNPSNEMVWRPISPAPPPKRAITPKPRENTPNQRRQSVQTSENPREKTPEVRKIQTPSKSRPAKGIQEKNGRLADLLNTNVNQPIIIPNGGNMIHDDPYKAPTDIGQCPHCGIIEDGLGRPGSLEKHYARSCKMMCMCKFCMKVVMNWIRHALNECYNNPRKNGPERDPREVQKERSELTRGNDKEKQSDEAEAEKYPQHVPVQFVGNSASNRMIDADKLVVALQEIQERKKAEKRRKQKEIMDSETVEP